MLQCLPLFQYLRDLYTLYLLRLAPVKVSFGCGRQLKVSYECMVICAFHVAATDWLELAVSNGPMDPETRKDAASESHKIFSC